MELHYQITQEDYIAFNLNYYDNNALVRRTVLTTRIGTTALTVVGGGVLLYWLRAIQPLAIAVYVALALLCFFGTPYLMRRKVVKNTIRILQRATNQTLCGAKTLTLDEQSFTLTGENENTTYANTAVVRTARDEAHFFLYVDEFSAIIVPFSAFESETQKDEFYHRLTDHITDDALKL